MSKRRVNLGRVGEQKAVEYLRGRGYKILERNFRCNLGEIDIIALDPSRNSKEANLVLVEVKTRWSEKYGPPEEAVTPRKVHSIIKTGQYYKILHPEAPNLMRIDVIALEIDYRGKTARLRHLKNVTG